MRQRLWVTASILCLAVVVGAARLPQSHASADIVFEPLPAPAAALFNHPVTFLGKDVQQALFVAAATSDLPVDFPPTIASAAVTYTRERLLRLIGSSRLLVLTPGGGQPTYPVQTVILPDENGALLAFTVSEQSDRHGDFNGPREHFFGTMLYNGAKARPTFVAPQATPIAETGVVRQDSLTYALPTATDPFALVARVEVTAPNPSPTSPRAYVSTTNVGAATSQFATGRVLYTAGLTTPAQGYTLGDYSILELLALTLRIQHDGKIEGDTRLGLIDTCAALYRLETRNDFRLVVHGIEWGASGRPRVTDDEVVFDLHVTWDDSTGVLQTLTMRTNLTLTYSHTGYGANLSFVPLFNPRAGERWDPQTIDLIDYDPIAGSDPGPITIPMASLVARMPRYGTIPWHGI